MMTDTNGEVNNFIEVKEQKKEDTIFGKKCTFPSLFGGVIDPYFSIRSKKKR